MFPTKKIARRTIVVCLFVFIYHRPTLFYMLKLPDVHCAVVLVFLQFSFLSSFRWDCVLRCIHYPPHYLRSPNFLLILLSSLIQLSLASYSQDVLQLDPIYTHPFFFRALHVIPQLYRMLRYPRIPRRVPYIFLKLQSFATHARQLGLTQSNEL